MKKLIAFLLVLCTAVSLCACAGNTTAAPSSSEPESSQPSEQATESELRTLFDNNLECNKIFYLNYLAYEEEAVEGTIHKVSDERFPTFAAFEEFVKGTYVAAKADELLNGERIEGHRLYQDVDGALCIDTYVIGGKGYYVDWSDYSIDIVSTTDTECEFTVTATVVWPAENPVEEDYVKTAKAVKEDGSWLLTELVY